MHRLRSLSSKAKTTPFGRIDLSDFYLMMQYNAGVQFLKTKLKINIIIKHHFIKRILKVIGEYFLHIKISFVFTRI